MEGLSPAGKPGAAEEVGGLQGQGRPSRVGSRETGIPFLGFGGQPSGPRKTTVPASHSEPAALGKELPGNNVHLPPRAARESVARRGAWASRGSRGQAGVSL